MDTHAHSLQIEVAGKDLVFRPVYIQDQTPSGAQIASIAGHRADEEAHVLQVLANGELEDVRANESVNLDDGARFIVVVSDRSYRLTIDGDRFDWPSRIVSGATLRQLGRVPPDKALYMERQDEPDRLIEPTELLDLDGPGIERFASREHQKWTLNVQGVTIHSSQPTILVKDALVLAGFDPNQAWHIFLKTTGGPKQEVGTDFLIDLRKPGIEKLRLTPKHVENGEARNAPRRDFALLDADEQHLDTLGHAWETINDQGRRWLLIHAYPIPPGFGAQLVDLALEIPLSYPGAQIDMFYVNPPLRLANGQEIPATQVTETICQTGFQRWSRHRTAAAPWNPKTDNVITHLALVESAIAKEVGL